MNNIKTICIAISAIIIFNINHAKAQLPSSDPAYQLVWADSFPGTYGVNLDTDKWKQKWDWNQSDSVGRIPCDTSKSFDRAYHKWYLDTVGDYYIDTIDCKIRGGNLIQWCRKENFPYGECWTWPSCPAVPDPCNAGPCSDSTCWHIQNKQFKYTACGLISNYKFRYGYFELRFKLPPAVNAPYKYSTSSNFFLWDANSTITASEIDIMELCDSNNYFTNNIHYKHSPNDRDTSQQFSPGTISADAWHTIGCLWTSHDIVFYLDTVEINRLTNKGIRPDSLLPMPIVLALGAPADNFCKVFDPVYSRDYNWQIDYVKVWQIKPACNTAKTFCATAFNPTTYISQDSLYQSVTLGGAGCAAQAINNTNYISIYGSNYVLLDEGFSIDNNSTAVIDVQDCIPLNNSFFYVAPQPQPMPDSFKDRLLRHYDQ